MPKPQSFIDTEHTVSTPPAAGCVYRGRVKSCVLKARSSALGSTLMVSTFVLANALQSWFVPEEMARSYKFLLSFATSLLSISVAGLVLYLAIKKAPPGKFDWQDKQRVADAGQELPQGEWQREQLRPRYVADGVTWIELRTSPIEEPLLYEVYALEGVSQESLDSAVHGFFGGIPGNPSPQREARARRT